MVRTCGGDDTSPDGEWSGAPPICDCERKNIKKITSLIFFSFQLSLASLLLHLSME